jgi:malate synthase
MTKEMIPGVVINKEITPAHRDILTPDALEFLADLERRFRIQRSDLLLQRQQRQHAFEQGERPDFLPETAEIRESPWTIGPSPLPPAIQDRRVEITGPAERKMMINGLNSGANVLMADFEDALSPTWENLLDGQLNVRDALDGTITYTSPEGKKYLLNDQVATLMVRPRGWHLPEKHVLIDGRPMAGSLFDFGLYFFHNVKNFIGEGTGAYVYLPKLENHLEARLWNMVFSYVQDTLLLPRGKIKATVLIETITAAFEMDEIIYELREHIAGLNCGRWDYIFSFIKKFRNDSNFVLPDRNQVTMTSHFLRAYSQLLIKTCHRRGAYAMGGMAAQIPIKDDPEANQAALDKVRADKEREASDGHDGTWVAHPDLVAVAREMFDHHMGIPRKLDEERTNLVPGVHDVFADTPQQGPNQLAKLREDVQVSAADLLQVPRGTITEAGLRNNISVAVQYLESWLRGQGCVPLYNLMEDAATAEIARAQLWQWVHQEKAVLEDGSTITADSVKQMFGEELQKIRTEVGSDRYQAGKFELAAEILENLTITDKFTEFLTLAAYDHL